MTTRMLVRERVGRSPHTFDAWDRRGRRRLVWFLDYEAIERDLPRIMPIEDWQLVGPGIDLADVALTTGIRS